MALTALLACLLFQNTWVVDDNLGPGVNFFDLPPAVAAAADGDILLVQPGNYSPFTLDGKGLRILGSGQSSTFVAGAGGTTISNVPSASLVSIEGLRFGHDSGSSTAADSLLLIQGSTTRVTLADVTCNLFSPGTDPSVDRVLVVEGAEVWVFRSMLDSGLQSDNFTNLYVAGTALHVTGGAKVHVSGSIVKGG